MIITTDPAGTQHDTLITPYQSPPRPTSHPAQNHEKIAGRGALWVSLTATVLQQFCESDSPPQFCFKVVRGQKNAQKKARHATFTAASRPIFTITNSRL